MIRTMLVTALVFVISSAAFADDFRFVTLESNSSSILAEIRGFPGRYWGMTPSRVFLSGDNNSLAWLSDRGFKYSSVILDPDIGTLYLCYFDNNNLPAESNITSGDRYIITAAIASGADAVRRLRPMAIPDVGDIEAPPIALTYDPTINVLIERVNRDTIIAFLDGLSGRESVEVGGNTDTIHTRYSGTDDNRMAAQYLKETLERYGYQAEYNGFYGGNLRHVAAYDAQRAWAVSEGSEALRTTNGGTTWLVMPDGTVNALWGVDNAGPDSVWIAGDIGTIKFSSDGGATFNTRTSSMRGFHFGVDFTNNLEGWIAADSGKIVHTNNGGASWTTQNTPSGSRFYDVCFVDNLYGWAVGRSGAIVHTTNGGANWAGQNSNSAQRLYGVKFTDRNNGWVVGWSGTVLNTTNGGLNWAPVNLGTITEMYHVDFADSAHGCIVGWDGEIYVTTNGGANWTQTPGAAGVDIYGIDFGTGLTGIAVGTGELSRTTDGGATWVSQEGVIESSWRNVIATRRGTTDPSRQVIICGHMDNTSQMPQSNAPGADDNGSGAVAVIEAARTLAGIPFQRTVKFCLWTGEEQGLLGSQFYATEAQLRGDTIIGVFNFDMIGWDGNNDRSVELHCGNMATSQAIGHLFEDVVTDYVIALNPEFLTWSSTDRSDHASFWDTGYPAILGIEDFSSDFNPYYHTTNDNMDIIDTLLFFNFVKAAVGSAATLALPDTDLVSVGAENPLPQNFGLSQNYPNPFNPSTGLAFNLPQAGHARLVIYDLMGRVVRTLADMPMEEGHHVITWNGRGADGGRASSGVYFARLYFDGMSSTIRMTLEK
jgi:photosystem II stability/assembly factor-like uncharacterized protein